MRTLVGVDVGNSTTEAVLVTGDGTVLAADRAPTRGVKGSPDSLRGAAVLVARLERRAGRPADVVVAAPQRPVDTTVLAVTPPAVDTGRLDVLPRPGDTPGGLGAGVGVPRWADGTPDTTAPVVLLVRAGTGFRAAARQIEGWRAAGADVRGVLLADDEAVLVGRRTEADVPVLDLVDVDRVARGALVALEVRAAGHALVDLGDPIRFGALLGPGGSVGRGELDAAVTAVGDASRAVVVLLAEGAVRDGTEPSGPVPPQHGVEPAQDQAGDRWEVGLREVATSVGAPVDAATSRDVVAAVLRAGGEGTDPLPLLTELLGPRVLVLDGETRAAQAGAMSTPGVQAGAVVVDVGGGSVDAIGPDGSDVVLAGAGELLTLGVARMLRVPLGAADFVKRGPCSRVESPQVLLAEDDTRTFLDSPADPAAVGQLAVEGPVGLLAFGRGTSPAQWRSLRRRLKERVLADNIGRALTGLGAGPGGDLLLVGGAAGDEELLGLLRTAVPGRAVGRAQVGGPDAGLEHRYAVAYGLTLLARQEAS